MNLCIDLGNSRTKVGIFDQNCLVHYQVFNTFGEDDLLKIDSEFRLTDCILSSVIELESGYIDMLRSRFDSLCVLDHHSLLPFFNEYKSPETLGKDRIAAVAGAHFLKPDSNLLVVDAGTAITYDFIDSHSVYRGGNIAPGLDIRFRSLHEYTSKLPLVGVEAEWPDMGADTQSAILSGVMNGIVYEIEGYFNRLKQNYPELLVFLTGGSVIHFAKKINYPIFVEPNLVLIGLNQILQYNVRK